MKEKIRGSLTPHELFFLRLNLISFLIFIIMTPLDSNINCFLGWRNTILQNQPDELVELWEGYDYAQLRTLLPLVCKEGLLAILPAVCKTCEDEEIMDLFISEVLIWRDSQTHLRQMAGNSSCALNVIKKHFHKLDHSDPKRGLLLCCILPHTKRAEILSLIHKVTCKQLAACFETFKKPLKWYHDLEVGMGFGGLDVSLIAVVHARAQKLLRHQ